MLDEREIILVILDLVLFVSIFFEGMGDRRYFLLFCFVLLCYVLGMRCDKLEKKIDKIKWILRFCDLVKVRLNFWIVFFFFNCFWFEIVGNVCVVIVLIVCVFDGLL